jgi:gas vesicle protein
MFSRKQTFPFGKVALGFGIGAVSGAVIALLFTPLSGKKMKKKVASATDHLLEKVEDTVDDIQATVRRIARA